MAEPEQDRIDHQEIKVFTAEIVGAYVSHHTVAMTELPDLIATVGKELVGLGQAPTKAEDEKPKPAVPIKRSVRPDGVVCLVCGKPQKMLKRHLATRHELTPDAYRETFGLMDDYPLVAPNYAATRSALAKKIGLGRKANPTKPAKAPSNRTKAKKPAVRKGKA